MKPLRHILATPLLCLFAVLGASAHADSEFWYLMTPADDLDKPMGFYHVKRTTDPESLITTEEMQQRARVNLFFFKIKVDETANATSDVEGLRTITADIRRGNTRYSVRGKRDGDAVAMQVNDKSWSIPVQRFEQTDLELVLPVNIVAIATAGTVNQQTLIPELDKPVTFTTRYEGKQVVKMPDGKRELHVLKRNDSREDQTLWVDDAGVVHVLIGKRRALVMSDKETVERWAKDNP